MYPLLDIQNLSVDFVSENESSAAVRNVSFSVNRNEILALVGESGSGKSVTSLSVLKLLPSPPAKYISGKILFSQDGLVQEDLLGKDRHFLQHIRGNKIAMIFQEPMTSLNPVLKCGDQVMEAIMTHNRMQRKEAKSRVVEWFERVKLPNPYKIFNRYPHELSGGQRQRVMIAIAMSSQPSLLICDEPTTALDVTVQKSVLQLIKELQQQSGMGVIFITHDLGVVGEIADKVVVMYKGEVVEDNTTLNIFTNPRHPYTTALLECRPVNHSKGVRLPVIGDFMEGKPVVKNIQLLTAGTSFTSESPILLKAEHLSVWFPARKNLFGKSKEFIRAVDDVSFELYKGETLGLVGESGCGKTTLGRALLRLVDPSFGKITYDGIDLTSKKKSELRKLRKNIQIIFQDPYSSLNPRLTIGSAITEPLLVHNIFSTFKTRKQKVEELLEKVDLKPEYFNRYPHEFSGGQRQRIVIARALALNPSFVVCDESVSALDVSVQSQVLNLLNDLKKEYGFTIIFISHDLSVVYYISDRIMVMNKGKIEENGPADDIYYRPKSPYTKQLIASIPRNRFAS